MFLAIINDTYAEVKSEVQEGKNEFPILDYFKSHYRNLLVKLGKQKEQIEGIQAALNAEGKQRLSYLHVRDELRKRNLTDVEIEMLFAKYDLDSNRELDQNELQKMFQDLEGKKKKLDKEIALEQSRPSNDSTIHFNASENLIKLTRRVDRIEHTLTLIADKIDAVLGGQLNITIPEIPSNELEE